MNTKNKKVIYVLLVVALMATSFMLSFVLQFTLGNKRIINVSEFERLKENDTKYAKLNKVREYVDKHYYLDTKDFDFEKGIIQGYFESFNDPYSYYLDEKMYKELMESSTGKYGGIGLVVEPNADGYITVVSPIEDTPAYAAGIKTGDKIIKIDGKEYGAKQLSEAVNVMRGKADTEVELTILRDNKQEIVKLKRAIIVIKSVKSSLLKDDKSIGYIRITSFDDKVDKEFINNYEALKAQGVKGIVIDLRNNPGGSLNECVKLADYILGECEIVSTKYRSGKEQHYKSDSKKIDLPYVVLVNGGSASASEILAGAIKDTKSGVLIGTKTYGKGLVQDVIPWGNSEAIKITVAQYFTTSGNYIHGKGIEPDITIELSDKFNKDDDSSDNQLSKAVEVLKQEIQKK